MTRIITILRRRKKYITTLLVLCLVMAFLSRRKGDSPSAADDSDFVVLSKRGIHWNLLTKIKGSQNHTELERRRRKSIHSNGVLLESFKPTGIHGFINVHLWHELCGGDLLTLKLFPLFPNVPSSRQLLSSLDISNLASSYGKRVFGYLIAPTSAKYDFRLKYSGTAEFWLSTNDKQRESRCILCLKEGNDATSARIYLRHSKEYYFEILHKHGGFRRLDFLSLQWRTHNSEYTTISAKYLQSYQDDKEISENVVNIDSFPSPGLEMHRKNEKLTSEKSSQKISREEIYKLPFISQNLIEDLFPRCKYKPDYVVNYKIGRYKSLWENIYAAVYPSDDTNATDRNSFVTFGNDVLLEDKALHVVDMTMSRFKAKGLR